MSGKKIRYVENNTLIDSDGCITEHERTKVIQFPTEPPFIKLYISDLTAILGLPNGAKDLLHALLMKMDYENMITLTSRSKKEIAERIGIKIQTFDNYLKKLTEVDVLRRIARGEYKVNPNIFARGDWVKITKHREEWEMIVTYKPDGTRNIKGQAVKSNNVKKSE